MDTANLATLPKISKADLENAKKENDAWNFLFVFTDKYFAMIEGNQEIMRDFTSSQHTLLAYNYLYGEVCNGGFTQLILNGYGGYVFDNPFSDNLREWGVEKIAEIVDAAKVVYQTYKERIEVVATRLQAATTIEEAEKLNEESSKLYQEIKDFEPLEDSFYEIKEKETEIIKHYVENHLEEFAVIE